VHTEGSPHRNAAPCGVATDFEPVLRWTVQVASHRARRACKDLGSEIWGDGSRALS